MSVYAPKHDCQDFCQDFSWQLLGDKTPANHVFFGGKIVCQDFRVKTFSFSPGQYLKPWVNYGCQISLYSLRDCAQVYRNAT